MIRFSDFFFFFFFALSTTMPFAPSRFDDEQNFRGIATMSGTKSGNEKRNIIKKLLVAAKGNETRFAVLFGRFPLKFVSLFC
jgi:hypothetical protein